MALPVIEEGCQNGPIRAIAETGMQPIPYIFFAGTCREAFETYGRIFGSDPQILSFGSLSEEARAGLGGIQKDLVMHAALSIGEGRIYGSDDAAATAPAMAGCNISVAFPDEAETRRVWSALAEGAEVRQDLGAVFWTALFGTMTDRFGTRWMIQTEAAAPV